MLPETPFVGPSYEGPGYVKIRLEPGEVKEIPHMHDVVLVKNINGTTFEALVPSHTLGENNSWVPAQYAGKISGKAVFHLPTANEGRPTWRVPEEAVQQILVA